MNIKTIWLIIEATLFTVIILYGINLYWLCTTYSIAVKMMTTFMGLLIIYDIYKGYLWTKWILIREGDDKDE